MKLAKDFLFSAQFVKCLLFISYHFILIRIYSFSATFRFI